MLVFTAQVFLTFFVLIVNAFNRGGSGRDGLSWSSSLKQSEIDELDILIAVSMSWSDHLDKLSYKVCRIESTFSY